MKNDDKTEINGGQNQGNALHYNAVYQIVCLTAPGSDLGNCIILYWYIFAHDTIPHLQTVSDDFISCCYCE